MKTLTIKHENMPEHLKSQDPLVLKTSWETLTKEDQSVASFKTHRLVKESDTRLKFKMGLESFLVSMIFLFFGIFSLWVAIFTHTDNPVAIMAFGLLFIGVGIYLFYILNKQIILDKSSMTCMKKNPFQAVENYFYLNSVHAVQLIKQYITDPDGDYYSHELNLVFNNAKRINLVCHGGDKAISLQAKQISEFLDIPLWDGRCDEPDDSSRLPSDIERIVGIVLIIALILISALPLYVIFSLLFQ